MQKLKVAHYDITTYCNLRCEGCYFFDTPEFANTPDERSDAQWDTFFQSESARGITVGMLAGAEPSFNIPRLRIASRHIPNCVVYTNGARHIPEDIACRIHLSCWGVGDSDKLARGVDTFSTKLRAYHNDPRVIIVYTISRVNIQDIHRAVAMAHSHGVSITFSYYSPSLDHQKKVESGLPNDRRFFRISKGQNAMVLSDEDLVLARQEIERAMRDHPGVVRYSLFYDDWITRAGVHRLDPATGVSTNCGVRKTKQENFKVDWTTVNMKCGSPQIDCATCRGYGPGYATYFAMGRDARHVPGGFSAWKETRRLWEFIFLGQTDISAPLAEAQEVAIS